MFDRFRAYGKDGQVICSGEPDKSGNATFKSDAIVEKVVFYADPRDAVAGTLQIQRKGKISVSFPEE